MYESVPFQLLLLKPTWKIVDLSDQKLRDSMRTAFGQVFRTQEGKWIWG